MPFARSTLSDLRQQAKSALVARLGLLVPTLQRWVLGVLGEVIAGAASGLYGYLGWQARQLFVSTADSEYIDRHGNELGVPRKTAAPAAGGVVFAGVVGGVVPAGTPLQTSDGTQSYSVQSTGTIGSAGTIDLQVEAGTAGSGGNQPAGAALTVAIAVSGIQGTATIDGNGLTGGLDVESDTLYRARVLARKQQPPQGGAASDYVAWAKLAPQCTRAWSLPRNRGGGTVDVTFVCDGRGAPGSAAIIPVSADITAVTNAISPLKPGQVDTIVFAPVADTIGVTISRLQPSTAQPAVTAALGALFASTTPGGAMYGDGVSITNPGGTLELQAISGAVSGAAGVTGFDLVAPTVDVVSAANHLATLGAVTFE